MLGEIKWYKPEKGYGFIKVDNRDKDSFVHKSNLKCSEELLYPRQRVSFSEKFEDKGWVAYDVEIPSGLILEGQTLGYNDRKGFGSIVTHQDYGRLCSHYSFRKENIWGRDKSFSYGTKVAFQPRKVDGKCFAIDVWRINPQGWGSSAVIDPDKGKEWIESASNNSNYYSGQQVYIFRGKGISDFYSENKNYVYKIGYSSQPLERLKSLQQKYKAPIEQFHEIYSDNAQALEQVIHAIFESKQYSGTHSWEWFVLDDDDLNWLTNIHFVKEGLLRIAVRNGIGMVGCEILFRGRGQ